MNAASPPEPGSQQVTDTQVTGHLFQIQGVAGNVLVNAGPMVYSAYLEQVRQIAPQQLHERDNELTELAAFCIEPGRGPYEWWQAGAWAGKSALMSWFVLHPPPGVRIVSFFVTSRYAGQNDRAAFTDVVLEQVAEMLGQSMPAFLTAATREAHLLGMLAAAAEAFQRRDERLVLVVDGLDEDRGVTTGPDAHSIAALLPTWPAAGLRIIAAGRPHPPISADVPDDHPLRDPGIVRMLGRSPWAEVVKADMQRELKRLLHGTPAEQDLLGLVTAAGGGLSGPDLAELTGLPVYDVEENLHAVAGRTFTTRPAHWQRGIAPPVYVLGHEELQTAATASLGDTRLVGYRQRLHTWADEYRHQGWPSGTPVYLLRGYFQMLQATSDTTRLVACALDRARHDRMLDLTGGDASGLAEIITAQEAILAQDDPDLAAAIRLARHRDDLASRTHIPSTLPSAWAALGQHTRAEALARSLTDPDEQARMLSELAEALVQAGQHSLVEFGPDHCASRDFLGEDPRDARRAEAIPPLTCSASRFLTSGNVAYR